MTLLTQKCVLHLEREAVARCPVCRGFYCRECVVEHEGRFVCNRCLTRIEIPAPVRSNRIAWLMKSLQAALGLLVAWLIFDLIGRLLLLVPPDFHQFKLPSPGP